MGGSASACGSARRLWRGGGGARCRRPVTGEEYRARIVLPNGFEYQEAEVGNTVSLTVTAAAPLTFEHQNTYAQLNAFDWSNAD